MCDECRRYKCNTRCPNYGGGSYVIRSGSNRNIVLNFYIKSEYRCLGSDFNENGSDEIKQIDINEIRNKEGDMSGQKRFFR